MNSRSRLLLLAITGLSDACALPLDEGRAFRQRLVGLAGQPASVLFEDIGQGDVEETETGRSYSWRWTTIGYGRPSGDCTIEIQVDDQERITAARMDGSDYICGEDILNARRVAARHRADPSHRDREEARTRQLLQGLVGVRRELSKGDDE